MILFFILSLQENKTKDDSADFPKNSRAWFPGVIF